MRFGRVEFLIRTARGGDRAGLRVRDACGFRAAALHLLLLALRLIGACGRDILSNTRTVCGTHTHWATGSALCVCGHVSHVEQKCDVGSHPGDQKSKENYYTHIIMHIILECGTRNHFGRSKPYNNFSHPLRAAATWHADSARRRCADPRFDTLMTR